jgi:ATP-binding cassette subfamily F protein 3
VAALLSGRDAVLKVSGITKAFGGRPVLDGVSFVLNDGELGGLIGPSGAGKTTLLRIIAGEERADVGSVLLPPGRRLGYLRQGYAGQETRPLRALFPALFTEQASEDELAALAARMAAEADPDCAAALADAYANALARLEDHAAGDEIEAARRALGLRPVAPDEPIAALSGGEQTKLGLLAVLAARPHVLLLDEPTNNLDIAGLEWLDAFLDRFTGPVLLVSHDRAFLDDHAAAVLELDPATGRLEVFPGGYSDYAEEKARRHAELWARYGRRQRRERRIRQAIGDLKGRAQRTENRTPHFHYRKRAAKVARRAVTLQRRLERERESDEHIDKPVKLPFRVRADIAEGERAGARLIATEGLVLAAGGRTLLSGVDFVIGWGERVALMGPNGSGKTTFLRALLGEHPPAAGGIYRSPAARPGYLPQGSGGMAGDDPAVAGATPLEIIRRLIPLAEAEARRFLHRFLFTSDQALTPLARLSYGERRRLDLARLVVAGANLLLLDEPTNHLDIPAREAFEAALESFSGTVLVVSHDRYFVKRFAERVLVIEDGHVRLSLA